MTEDVLLSEEGEQRRIRIVTRWLENVSRAVERRFDFDVWVPNERWQAIADELNRQIGGTCEMETDWDYLHDGIPDAPEDTWAYMCSACGWSFRYDRGIKPKHCPNCGKAVKR